MSRNKCFRFVQYVHSTVKGIEVITIKKQVHPTEKLQLDITNYDHQGNGVAVYRHPPVNNGPFGKKLIVTVPDTVIGDKVQVTVPNAKGRKKATVQYDELIKWSPHRISEQSTHQLQAGGTPWRHMDYQAQLTYKEQQIRQYLVDQNFDPNLLLPIIGMEDPYHYRNKMELTFGSAGAIGMHVQGNHRMIVDMEDSLIAPQWMVDAKRIVSQWQQSWDLSSFDKEKKTGLLRQLMMRGSKATGECMVVLFATEPATFNQPVVDDLVHRLAEVNANIQSIIWCLNDGIADKSDASEVTILYGRDFIYDELCGFHYRIWFDTFFQPNPQQAEKMVKTALDYSQVDETMRVLDLFCGVGSFSLPFAKRAKALAGIEIVPTSIESAKQNAIDNGLDNTYFIARDVRKGMSELEEIWGTPDLVVLDPPRSGAGGKVMRRIGRLQTNRIIYLSCNPKTMVEDIVWLREFGYKLVKVQPIDQFPHTQHVETVALMTKCEAHCRH